MAQFTPLQIKVDPSVHASGSSPNGIWRDSIDKVNELLNDDHQRNHTFFMGVEEKGVSLHNHMVHQALTLLAIGAPPDVIQRHHERNQLYQRQFPPIEQDIVQDLGNPQTFRKCLSKEQYYGSFLRYFEESYSKLGRKKFFDTFISADSELANTLFDRLFIGYLHPLISFGFGVEFNQPAIICAGLASGCCQEDDWILPFLDKVNKLSKSGSIEPLSLVECLEAARRDPKIATSSDLAIFKGITDTKFEEATSTPIALDQMKDGFLAKAYEETLVLAARWQVREDEIERKTAEITNTAALLFCGAQNPPHECRFDFFLMHTLTPSAHFPRMIQDEDISRARKAQIIEYMGRMALFIFIGAGCPSINLIYALKHPPSKANDTWTTIYEDVFNYDDDGHMSKALRSLKNALEICAVYDDRPEFYVKQQMFIPLARAILDSASNRPMDGGFPQDYIRGCGFEEAWAAVPQRKSITTL